MPKPTIQWPLIKINPFSERSNDTSFASNSNDTGGRLIIKDDSYNVIKEGMPFHKRFSIFNDMLVNPIMDILALRWNEPVWKACQ